MFEKFGGGEKSKQAQAVETILCQANNVGQFRQAFKVDHESCYCAFLLRIKII